MLALAVSGSDVYAGGTWSNGIDRFGWLAKWDGDVWLTLGSGWYGYVVGALAASGSDLYVAGSFRTAGGGPGDYLAKWDGSGWSGLGSGINGPVYALTLSGSDLYAGGYFTIAGGKVSAYVAKAIAIPGDWLQILKDVPGPGSNTLNYVGVPSAPYLVQFATNPNTNDWFTLATNTVGVNGRGMVLDSTATNGQRFYRIIAP